MKSLRLSDAFRFLIPVMLLVSCSSYRELTIDSKVPLTNESSGYRFSDPVDEHRPGLKTGSRRVLRLSAKKYLAKGPGFSAGSEIMNAGVNETLKGNYIEAEILFKQVQEDIADGSVENNLAVIYELTKREKEAMEMYSSALLKSPDNPEFRSNLLSFISLNKYEVKK